METPAPAEAPQPEAAGELKAKTDRLISDVFADNLRSFRLFLRITQRKMGEMLGLTEEAYRSTEKGRTIRMEPATLFGLETVWNQFGDRRVKFTDYFLHSVGLEQIKSSPLSN